MLEVISTIFALENILAMFGGVAAGIVIGAMPGLSIIMAIVLLLPLTYDMNSITGMYLLLGAYCGGTYGGSISAILINTPGTAVAAATLFDGYPMSKQGKASDALRIALVGSTFGGIFSCFALIFLAPLIASFAFTFAAPEFFALSIFGLTMVAGVSGKSIWKGIIAACLGLALTTVGMDPIDGVSRFMFGQLDLLAGIKTITVMLGIFALSEMVRVSVQKSKGNAETASVGKVTVKFMDILKKWKLMIVSSLIGLYVGAVPGTGGSIGAYMCYNYAKNSSKEKEQFGNGALEGVLAPETGNNATTGSALIPMLTLGIPGSPAVAILMSALAMQNITPGPQLFEEGSTWIYSIMIGLIVINVFMFFQGLAFAKFFTKICSVPKTVLIPSVVVLCVLGCYSMSNSNFDVGMMMIFTVLGLLVKSIKLPVAPLALGMVLGSLTESNFRRAMVMSDGDLSIFVTRPISLVILLIAVYSLISPFIKSKIAKRKAAKAA